MLKPRFVLALSVLAVAALALFIWLLPDYASPTIPTNTAAPTVRTVSVDGIARRFYIHTPEAPSSQARPLLIVLGHSGTGGRGMAALTGFDALPALDDMVIAYPENTSWYWDDGRVAAGLQPIDRGVNEAAFIDTLIRSLAATENVDTSAVYLLGYRDGGRLAYSLACHHPYRFRQVVVVNALMWEYIADMCPADSGPTDMLIVSSSDDPVHPQNGRLFSSRFQTDDRRFNIWGLAQTVDFWLGRSDCDRDSVQRIQDADVRIFDMCADGRSVTQVVIHRAGASWPRLGDGYPLNQVGVDYSAFVAAYLTGDTTWPQMTTQSSAVRETSRSYGVVVPDSYMPDQPTPLVVMLHPRPLTGADFVNISGMNPVVHQEGFIAVYPDGIDDQWYYDEGMEIGAPFDHYSDLAFIPDLVDHLSVDLNIDRERVYLVGMSSGGFMAQRLLCERPDVFASAVIVGASAFPGLAETCSGQPPRPIMFVHGTEDHDVRWDGYDAITNRGRVFITEPVPDTIYLWATHNGCNTDYALEPLPPSGRSPDSSVVHYTFDDCSPDAPMTFYAVVGGGHAWPGVSGPLPEDYSGQVNMDLNTAEVAWAFLSSS